MLVPPDIFYKMLKRRSNINPRTTAFRDFLKSFDVDLTIVINDYNEIEGEAGSNSIEIMLSSETLKELWNDADVLKEFIATYAHEYKHWEDGYDTVLPKSAFDNNLSDNDYKFFVYFCHKYEVAAVKYENEMVQKLRLGSSSNQYDLYEEQFTLRTEKADAKIKTCLNALLDERQIDEFYHSSEEILEALT